jgi:hypothetical protein
MLSITLKITIEKEETIITLHYIISNFYVITKLRQILCKETRYPHHTVTL